MHNAKWQVPSAKCFCGARTPFQARVALTKARADVIDHEPASGGGGRLTLASGGGGGSLSCPRPMNDQHLILVDLATILLVAALLVLLLGRLKQPAILGFLIAGALVGPSGLKLVADPTRVDQIA